jgi:hypothetical protein
MKKRFLVLTLTVLAIATLVLGLRWRKQGGAISKVRASSREVAKNNNNPLSELDRRAKEARSGDSEATRALADEIFTSTLPDPESQNPIVEDVKDRLVRAELEYRGKGRQKSIDESNVVRTVNQAVDILKLPDYAKTSPLQVRHLRLSLLPYLPHFIAQEDFAGRTTGNLDPHFKISNKVSPLEAAYLVLAVVQQKRNNPAFEVTPKEFRESVHARNLAAWRAHRESKNSNLQESPSLRQQAKPTKGEAIERSAAYGMGNLPISELVSIPGKLMDTLLTSKKEAKQ